MACQVSLGTNLIQKKNSRGISGLFDSSKAQLTLRAKFREVFHYFAIKEDNNSALLSNNSSLKATTICSSTLCCQGITERHDVRLFVMMPIEVERVARPWDLSLENNSRYMSDFTQ